MPLPILAPPGSTPDQRIAALEKAILQVAQVANGALQIGPSQRSPVPGELIGVRVTTPLPAGQPSMTLDLIQGGAGRGPILVVNDGTYQRVQSGNLATYTDPNGITSPATYGLRVLDALGNLLFDSIGISAVAKVVASQIHAFGAGQTIVGPGSAGGLGGGTEKTVDSVTVTPANRNITYMLLGYLTGFVQVSAGPLSAGNLYLKLDGTVRTNMVVTVLTYGTPLPADANYGLPPSILIDFMTLAPGSHTITMTWDMFEGASDTLTTYSDALFAIQMGG